MKQNITIAMLGLIAVLLIYIAASIPNTPSKQQGAERKTVPNYDYKIVRYYSNADSDKEFDTWFNKNKYEYVGILAPFHTPEGKQWGYEILIRHQK